MVWGRFKSITFNVPLRESLQAQMVENLTAVQETWVQFLGWKDPLEKGMDGYPLQYSCLENSMNRGAWRVTVHRITKELKQLSN